MPPQHPLASWVPPGHWTRILTFDVHAAGEPLRVVVEGIDTPQGGTMLERRGWAERHLDRIRSLLMWEPRGHREMYGCILTEPVTPGADFGILFMHNEGFSTMCGHGIIAIATVAVEAGLVAVSAPETVMRIDTPAGTVTASVRNSGGRAQSVRFQNVPSFVVARDQSIEVPELGGVTYDLAFGGAYYAFVQAQHFGLRCTPDEAPRLIETGMKIKRAVAAARTISHPSGQEMGFLYGTIFIAPPLGNAHSRNVCIFANGQVDRSPTGTGVSARMALHFARGEVSVGEERVIESIIGTQFIGRVMRPTTFGPYNAIIPEVEGSAYITGRHEFFRDPGDPLCDGFLI